LFRRGAAEGEGKRAAHAGRHPRPRDDPEVRDFDGAPIGSDGQFEPARHAPERDTEAFLPVGVEVGAEKHCRLRPRFRDRLHAHRAPAPVRPARSERKSELADGRPRRLEGERGGRILREDKPRVPDEILVEHHLAADRVFTGRNGYCPVFGAEEVRGEKHGE